MVLLVAVLGCTPRVSIQPPPPKLDKVTVTHPRNIVLMIGDGMGMGQITAALYANNGHLNLARMPVVGYQKTHSSESLRTDSAASATAMACGEKTYNSAIGLNKDSIPCRTILEELDERGWATGLVATVSITHATPAAFIAHQNMRSKYESIALDFLETDIDLVIGGGMKYFSARRHDGRNLIAEWKRRGYYVSDYFRKGLNRLAPPPGANMVYFTADNHPLSHMQGRDYLPDAAAFSMEFLSGRSPKGFFIMIEGSQIDWACHANAADQLIEEMLDFDEAVGRVLAFAKRDRETLVIVTADHECGGVAVNPGSKLKRPRIEFTTHDHTASMVPVFAYGPKAELFSGVYDNTEIYFKMKQALGLLDEKPAAN